MTTTVNVSRHAAVASAVARRAAALDLARIGVSAVALPLVCLGWLSWRTLTVLRTGLRWSLAAFLVGVDLARGRGDGAG